MRRSRLMILGVASLVAPVLLVSSPGAAAPRYSGTITGSFGAPVLSGAFLRPGSREPVLRENAGTARASAVDPTTITWGGSDNGCATAASSLTFNGDAFSDVPPGQVFRLG